MPKWNKQTPPPSRDPIITHSRASESTSGEKVVQFLDTVPITPGQEQDTPSDRYILVLPILGPIIVEQLLKGNSHNVAEFIRKFTEDHPTQDLPQINNQDSPSPSDQNNERCHELFNELSTPGLDLGSLFPESETPQHNIQAGGPPPSPPSSSSSSDELLDSEYSDFSGESIPMADERHNMPWLDGDSVSVLGD